VLRLLSAAGSGIFNDCAKQRNLQMRVFAAVAFSSAVVLTPVLATAQAASTEAAAAVTSPSATAPAAAAMGDNSGVNLNEVVCKNSPPPLGSRLGGGRECHTQREWNQRQQESQELTRQQQRMGATSADPHPH
jgi:hypothetical protein